MNNQNNGGSQEEPSRQEIPRVQSIPSTFQPAFARNFAGQRWLLQNNNQIPLFWQNLFPRPAGMDIEEYARLRNEFEIKTIADVKKRSLSAAQVLLDYRRSQVDRANNITNPQNGEEEELIMLAPLIQRHEREKARRRAKEMRKLVRRSGASTSSQTNPQYPFASANCYVSIDPSNNQIERPVQINPLSLYSIVVLVLMAGGGIAVLFALDKIQKVFKKGNQNL